MLKKLIAIPLALGMSFSGTVFADYLQKAEFTSDLKVKVEGSAADAAGKKAAVLIYPSDANLSLLGSASTPADIFATVDYWRETTIGEDGSFGFEVLFDDKEKGYRDIKLSVDGTEEIYEKAVYVVKESDITKFIDDINFQKSSDLDFEVCILDGLPIIAQEDCAYAKDESVRSGVAKQLISVRDFMYDGKLQNLDDVRAALNMALMINDMATAESADDIYTAIDNYSESSLLVKECFMAYYDDYKAECAKALLASEDPDAKIVYNTIGEVLILTAVSEVSNHNEITGIINDSNDFLNLNLKKYNALKDKSSVNKALIKKTSSLETFKSAFEELVDDASDSGNKGSGSGGGGGGKVSSSPSNSGGVVGNVTFENTPGTQIVSKEYFNDLAGYDWAKSGINYLAEHGIVSGVGEGRFEPSRYVTREEFVKMIVGAFSYTDSTATSSFADITPDDWCYSYVSSAYQKGYINGVTDTLFGKGSTIKRQDAAVILARITGRYASGTAKFADLADVSDYALDAVSLMWEMKVINGNEKGEFLPQESLTRAECAKVIYGLLQQSGEVK